MNTVKHMILMDGPHGNNRLRTYSDGRLFNSLTEAETELAWLIRAFYEYEERPDVHVTNDQVLNWVVQAQRLQGVSLVTNLGLPGFKSITFWLTYITLDGRQDL